MGEEASWTGKWLFTHRDDQRFVLGSAIYLFLRARSKLSRSAPGTTQDDRPHW